MHLNSRYKLLIITICSSLTVGLTTWIGTRHILAAREPDLICQPAILEQAQTDFNRLFELQTANPHLVSDRAYREAARRYIAAAEACYQAMVPPQTQTPPAEPILIDEGGVWAPGFGPPSGEIEAQFNTYGTKWGSGSPYSGGENVSGPRLPGGVVTYSFIPNGVSHAAEGYGNNTYIGSLSTFQLCFFTEIANAFAAWSAVANIQFVEVADNGRATNASGAVGDIRIGAHTFDGPNGVLAHAYYPPPNGISIAGDLHFDSAEAWACAPAADKYDIGLVALHEIGHSLGLGHEPTIYAVMNAYYNPLLTGLLTDDINGIVSIYGPFPLSIVEQSNPAIVSASTNLITYTLYIYNNGGADLIGVSITDTIPASTTYVNGSASHSGQLIAPGSKVIAWPVTTINAYTAISRTFKVTIPPLPQGDLLINTTMVKVDQSAQTYSTNFVLIVDPRLTYLPLIFKN